MYLEGLIRAESGEDCVRQQVIAFKEGILSEITCATRMSPYGSHPVQLACGVPIERARVGGGHFKKQNRGKIFREVLRNL